MYRSIRLSTLVLIAFGFFVACDDSTTQIETEPPSIISPEDGGKVEQDDVVLDFPPGALQEDTEITVDPAPNAPPEPSLVGGSAYEFGPDGIQFDQPVMLTLEYDEAALPEGIAEGDLAVHKVYGSEWRRISGSTVNPATNRVSAPITSFSTYGLLGRGQPSAISITAGDGQNATAGETVAIAPEVQVTDSAGEPLLGVDVEFAVTSGGGTVGSEVATTDIAGQASPGSWTLGEAPGENTLSARVDDDLVATFTATAEPVETGMQAASGDQQHGRPGSELPEEPTVRVVDGAGNPVAGVSVAFEVSGNGAVANTAAVTDAEGMAGAGAWTLGTEPADETLLAIVAEDTVAFTATALDCTAGGVRALGVGDEVEGDLTSADCIDSGDRAIDYFTLDLTEPATFEIAASVSDFTPRVGTLEGDRAVAVQLSSQPGFTRAALSEGSYRVYLGSVEGGTGAYSFSLTASAADGTECGTHDVTFVNVGSTVTDAVTADDCADQVGDPENHVDWYYLAAVAGQTYQATFDVDAAALFSLWGPEDGNFVFKEHRQTTGAGTATLTFTASEDAFYLLHPIGRPDIAYTMSVENITVTDACLPHDDMPVGTWLAGEFNAADCDAGAYPEDYYAFELDEQTSFTFEFMSEELPEARLGLTYGERHYVDYSDADSKRRMRMTLAPGSYWVGVLAQEQDVAAHYELSSWHEDHDAGGCGGAFNVTVTPGVSTSGSLTAEDCADEVGDPNDVWDAYTLWMQQGLTYRITMSGSGMSKMSLWGPTDSTYVLKEHRQSATGSTFTLTHTATHTGTHTINPLAPPGLSYEISFAEVQPSAACEPGDAFQANTFLIGALTDADCDADAYPEDFYLLELTEATNLRFTMNSSEFGPDVSLQNSERQVYGVDAATDSTGQARSMRVNLGAGTYWLGAGTSEIGARGTYDMSQELDANDANGCGTEYRIFVTDGAAGGGSISEADCYDQVAEDNLGIVGQYTDTYLARLDAGQTIHASYIMSGPSPKASIWGYNSEAGEWQIMVHHEDASGSGTISHTAAETGWYYVYPIGEPGMTYQLEFSVTGAGAAAASAAAESMVPLPVQGPRAGS